MEPTALLIFSASLLISAGSPGPSIVALVSRVLSRGWRDVLPFLAAMWIGEAIWLGIAVAGLAALAESYYWVFQIIKWIGVAYLLYLAWQMWFSPSTSKVDETHFGSRSSDRGQMFSAGLLVTLGNPKIMVFYIALLPTLLDMAHVSLIGWASLTAVMFVVLAAVDLGYVALASTARRMFTQGDLVKWLNRGCAGVMVGAATMIAARS